MTNSELDLNSNGGLLKEASQAAKGDETALDQLFEQLGGSGWGVAFAAADAVGPAADALSRGFAETLHGVDAGKSGTDVRVELLRNTRNAALSDPANQEPIFVGAHAREPLTLLGETKDRQATLAFTALPEELRSALWLSEAEGLTVTRTAALLNKGHKEAEELIRQARANFRGYYVDAVKRDGLGAECSATLDKLAGYVGRTLPAGEVATVENHLADCKNCRGIVMSLDDLEGRLHAAIPPLPAWARQQVADTWADFAPVTAVPAFYREPAAETTNRRPAIIGGVAVAAAAILALLGVTVLGGGGSSKTTVAIVVTTTTVGAVDTPTTGAPETTTTIASPAVATPAVIPETTTTTAVPATTTTPPTTAKPRVTTTTTAAPKPPATTTTLPDRTLINLPPTPIGARR